MAKVPTIHGDIDEERLHRHEEVRDGKLVVEYYLGEECVHRSVMVPVTGVGASATAAKF